MPIKAMKIAKGTVLGIAALSISDIKISPLKALYEMMDWF
jgi:hypothetical protein